MQSLLKFSRGIDAFTKWVGKRLAWLILVAVVVATVNAIIRKTFDVSSNSWLELQWLLFSIVFLFCAPWTLLDNEHIRIDIISNMMKKKLRDWVDVVGHAFFLIPLCIVMIITGGPFFMRSVEVNEQSSNAGGLPQWPAKSLVIDRIYPAARAGHIRTDQANRRHARFHPGSACNPGARPRGRGRASHRSDRKTLTAEQGRRGI